MSWMLASRRAQDPTLVSARAVCQVTRPAGTLCAPARRGRPLGRVTLALRSPDG